MKLKQYIGAKMISLLVTGIGIVYFFLVLILAEVQLEMMAFILGSLMIFVIIYHLTNWWLINKQFTRTKRMMEALPEKYLVGEIIEKPTNAMEYEYYLLMKEISRSAIGIVEKTKQEYQAYTEYVESWIHEVKTPLTACTLLAANHGNGSEIRKELRRIDSMMDTILALARLDSIDQDTQIRKVELRELCDQAIREEMELLIAAGIALEIEGVGTVFTDSKMVVMIMKQLLVNATKYCPNCRIDIRLSDDKMVVEDNGPGIPAHELRRVTQRGFTGEKWRNSRNSTGMGLFIVSEICRQLSISMEITSEEGKFTRFCFDFCS